MPVAYLAKCFSHTIMAGAWWCTVVLLKLSGTTEDIGYGARELTPGPPGLWYKLLIVRLWHYRSQDQASLVICWFSRLLCRVIGSGLSVLANAPMALALSAHACNLVSSVSKCTARTPVIIITIIKWGQTNPWWGTTSYTSTGCHNWTSSVRFPKNVGWKPSTCNS